MGIEPVVIMIRPGLLVIWPAARNRKRPLLPVPSPPKPTGWIFWPNVEDLDFNFTRFFVLGLDEPPRQDPSKTSIILTTRHVAGALYQVLGELANRDISMTKIESRPRRNRPWHYLFYIDFEGHEDDPPVREALLDILKSASFLKVLGSYPAARE
jgi:prephenate dehydratase